MKQYHELLTAILEHGHKKEAARENMPGSISLFGHQSRYDLSGGFPILTTKKVFWKGIVGELLWMLSGNTNIKYLVDNGSNFWNEDAYNYYVKIASANGNAQQNPILKKLDDNSYKMFLFDEFVDIIKNSKIEDLPKWSQYTLGDCGHQYGKVWRRWSTNQQVVIGHNGTHNEWGTVIIDQIQNVIKSLKESPESRRHIVTAVDPVNDKDLALYWCHSMFQFNCRKLTDSERALYYYNNYGETLLPLRTRDLDFLRIPKYKLDCQLYQRSADVFLGYGFNMSSYSLLTLILCKICNMVPGEFIHTAGDAHIYDNHLDAVNEQLSRDYNKYPLPTLKFSDNFNSSLLKYNQDNNFDVFINSLTPADFVLENYQSYPAIKAELSTGLIK